ncbi:hypothetical protein QJS66_00085 [Kocuria rhizophila]|nr:hypothetical protein QJS66_00085 [Kocuria rhizophila]
MMTVQGAARGVRTAAAHAAASAPSRPTRPRAAGAIPIVRPMRTRSRATAWTGPGTTDGTTNFVLDQMDTTGAALTTPWPGPAPGLRGGGPHRGRGGPRRCRQDCCAGVPGVPLQLHDRRRPLRGHPGCHGGGRRGRTGSRVRDQAVGGERCGRA